MESIRINDILKNEVSVVNKDMSLSGVPITESRSLQKVEMIIDELGAHSAHEQKLKRIITSSSKLKESDHILYLLKDAGANGGAGLAIGLLKVGCKNLFLYDSREQVIEAKPLCVLDFYVHNSYQRQGMGKRLFDYMLMDQKTRPVQLAIDGPSEPMTKFLSRQYGMKILPKQANNFAVAAPFFEEVKHISHYGIDRRTYLSKNPDHQATSSSPRIPQPTQGIPQPAQAFGRFAAHQRECTAKNIIQGIAEINQPNVNLRK